LVNARLLCRAALLALRRQRRWVILNLGPFLRQLGFRITVTKTMAGAMLNDGA
jgi:hypothetical protein